MCSARFTPLLALNYRKAAIGVNAESRSPSKLSPDLEAPGSARPFKWFQIKSASSEYVVAVLDRLIVVLWWSKPDYPALSLELSGAILQCFATPNAIATP